MRKKVFIIAEAGVNHNGDFELAKQLIDKAVEAKVDAVKFQTFCSELLVTPDAGKAAYQKETTDKDENQISMLKKLEMSFENQVILKDYCEEKNITFLSTAFDLKSADFLNSLSLPVFKIPSGEITNYPYLKKIASFKKDVIISTGMANMQEIKESIELFNKEGIDSSRITILHCSTEYPTPFKNVNLNAMATIKNEFGVNVGYSDHTTGISVPIAAVALGAKVIEKHFTLDKEMEGPDHRASLDPTELKNMVRGIREIENSMGDGTKVPSLAELENAKVVRKSLIAAKDIQIGDIFSEENLTTKRPGSGISPMKWKEYLGKSSTKKYSKNDLI